MEGINEVIDPFEFLVEMALVPWERIDKIETMRESIRLKR
jgi:hypothetical protein